MDVLKLEDIEQEYMLVHARLRLLQKDPDPSYAIGMSVDLLFSRHGQMFPIQVLI